MTLGGFRARRSCGKAQGGSMQAACDRRSNAATRTPRPETLEEGGPVGGECALDGRQYAVDATGIAGGGRL